MAPDLQRTAPQPHPSPASTELPRPVPYLSLAAASTVAPEGDLVAPSALGSRASLAPGTATGPAASSVQLKRHLMRLDALALAVAWLGVSFVASHGVLDVNRFGIAIGAVVVALALMAPLGLYRARKCTRKGDELWRVVAVSISGGVVLLLAQVSARGSVRWSTLLAATAASIVAVEAARWHFRRYLRARRADREFLRPVIVVGTGSEAEELLAMLRSEPELGYSVAGVVGEGAGDGACDSPPRAPSASDIPWLAAATGACGILIVPCGLSGAMARQAVSQAAAASLHVQVWPGIGGVGSRRLRSAPVSGEPFFYVEPRASARWQLGAKRAVDIAGAALGLIAASPVLALAAALIVLEDRGPVLYRTERIGAGGRPFRAYKLRTMTPENDLPPAVLASLAGSNERTDGPLFKARNDPRVTKVGRVLRSSSLDELPQLWNVLRATMSLVGPRPALPREVLEFDPDLRRRHSVRPGMTGLWQVEARRNPSFLAYRRLDLLYVDNWSLWLDLSILCATVPAILSHALRELRGARRS